MTPAEFFRTLNLQIITTAKKTTNMAPRRTVKNVQGKEQDVFQPDVDKSWIGDDATRQACRVLTIAEDIIEIRKSLLHAQLSIRETQILHRTGLPPSEKRNSVM